MNPNPTEELVVLLDEAGREVGTARKAEVHGRDTPLHLAFSCYVFNPDGEVLLTRRALGKKTWAGVWSNSFCGHPMPAEPVHSAVSRRGRMELGLDVDDLTLALPGFRYRATDVSGMVENEVCPVYLSTTAGQPQPNTDEVCEHRWVSPSRLSAAIAATPWIFSPWMVLQVGQLDVFP